MTISLVALDSARVATLGVGAVIPVLDAAVGSTGSGPSGAGGVTLQDLGTYLGSIISGPVAATSVTFTTNVKSVSALATPSAYIATTGALFASTVSGATLMGFGTTGDVTLKNRAGTDVIVVTANTTGVTMAGALAITGALSGVTTLAISGGLSGVTTLAMSGALTGGTTIATSSSIKSAGPAGGIGYATGAGSAATQSTNKSTTVAFNAMCGAITMNAAQLDAGVIVSFTFTNTSVAATDVMVLNHISGGTIGSYTLNAQCGAATSVINVMNNTAGNLSEAIVIQFAIIKGVNS